MSKPLRIRHLAITTLLLFVLTGCAISPSETPSTQSSEASESKFFPNGSAENNMPIFESVLKETGAGKPDHDLNRTISALVEAGFSLETITHTPVTSKIGETADSVSLALEFGNECLVAQFSSSYLTTAVVEPTISGCLIGDVIKATED